MEAKAIINSTVQDVLNQMPPHGFFQQLYWEGSDGEHKGIVMISGEDACRLMREAAQFISEDPIEGPGGEEIVIDRKGNIAAIIEKMNEQRMIAPEREDAEVILACLADAVRSCDDQLQMSESSEILAACLSSKRSKSSAQVLASLLRLIVNSGIPLGEVVRYMKQREINDRPLSKLRNALDTIE